MLVLTRRTQETIILSNAQTGEEIAQLKILDVRGNQVRVGCVAPKWVQIDRIEVYTRVQMEMGERPDDAPNDSHNGHEIRPTPRITHKKRRRGP